MGFSAKLSRMIHRVVALTLLTSCSYVTVRPDHDDDEQGGRDVGGAANTGGSGGGGGVAACPGDWLHILGGTGANWLRSQAVGPDGSVAVTVDNTDDLSVDGVPLDLEPSGLVVLKFRPTGDFEWARRFGQSWQQTSLPVAFDPAGNVIVGGVGYGTIDLGSIVAEHDFAVGYVASFSPDGVPLWLQSWEVPIESGGLANLAVDSVGNIFFQGGLGYDGDTLTWGPFSTDKETFIGKIAPDGSPLWLRGFDGILIELRGLATTPEGHVVLGQSLTLTGTFDGVELSTPGDFDALTVELDADGAVVDARQYGDDELQRAGGFVIGPTGSRALTGVTWGAIDFGTGPVSEPDADDYFVAAFDANGEPTWTKTAPNTYAPSAMVGTSDGGLALVLSADVATALGCGAAEPGFVLAEIDAAGNCSIEERIAHCGDEPYCEVYFGGVARSADRNVVSGYFSSELFLRDEAVTAEIWDGFVMSKSICPAL